MVSPFPGVESGKEIVQRTFPANSPEGRPGIRNGSSLKEKCAVEKSFARRTTLALTGNYELAKLGLGDINRSSSLYHGDDKPLQIQYGTNRMGEEDSTSYD